MATQIINRYRPVVAPRLPSAPVEYNAQYQEQFMNVLRLYFNQLDGLTGALLSDAGGRYINFPYGAFQDNTTQTAAATNTAYAITFNTTDLSNSVSVGSPASRIVVANAGVYNFQFSLQLDKASGGSAHAYIWARVNGTDIPNSAGEVAIQGTTAENIAAWNYVLALNASDYFQLMWSTTDTNVQLKSAAAAAPVPAIPSVILTATFVSALST